MRDERAHAAINSANFAAENAGLGLVLTCFVRPEAGRCSQVSPNYGQSDHG
jgi:hypothetical protein